MLQVVNYMKTNSLVSVGFKKYNFVVYGQMAVKVDYIEEQYLQELYEICKSAIDYETQRYLNGEINSIVTEEEGEEFIPEPSKVSSITLKVDKTHILCREDIEDYQVNLSCIIKDQYGEIIDDILPIITTSLGDISENILTIPKVEVVTEVIITATLNDIEVSKTIIATTYVEKIDYIQESINNALDRVNIIEAINIELVSQNVEKIDYIQESINNALDRVNIIDSTNVELVSQNVELSSCVEDLTNESAILKTQTFNLEEENISLMIASAEAYETMYSEDTQLMLAIAEVYETLFVNGLII